MISRLHKILVIPPMTVVRLISLPSSLPFSPFSSTCPLALRSQPVLKDFSAVDGDGCIVRWGSSGRREFGDEKGEKRGKRNHEREVVWQVYNRV